MYQTVRAPAACVAFTTGCAPDPSQAHKRSLSVFIIRDAKAPRTIEYFTFTASKRQSLPQ